MISLATETDRTLFFDFLPLDLGTTRGFKTRFPHLYTVPGQVFYDASRKLILNLHGGREQQLTPPRKINQGGVLGPAAGELREPPSRSSSEGQGRVAHRADTPAADSPPAREADRLAL